MATGTIERPTALSGQVNDSESGVSMWYRIFGQICFVSIGGTPTTTNQISFTDMPKALIGSHTTHGQWGNTANQIQIWIDDNSTTMNIRNHVMQSLNETLIYICQ